ncbi:MAG: glycosyltransferase family 4 protein [Pseudomonadota bacterium]
MRDRLIGLIKKAPMGPALVRLAKSAVSEPARARARARLADRLGGLADWTDAGVDLLGARPLHITFGPLYDNPYQMLFYGAPRAGYAAEAGGVGDALARLSAPAPAGAIRCYHQHWLNQTVHGEQSAEEARRSADDLVAQVTAYREAGGLFAWTLHNLASHEGAHAAVEQELNRRLAAAADVVIAHGAFAAEQAVAAFGAAPERVLATPHGSYIGVYADEIGRAGARAARGLGEDRVCFAFLGFLRRYKGLEELVSVGSEMARTEPRMKMLIAGAPIGMRASDLAELAGPELDLTLIAKSVPDDEVQGVLRAADWCVLPFRKVLTSGSTILALSFGAPVIAPAMGVLPEVVTDGREGFLYAADDPDGLREAMRRALETPPERRAEMAAAARARAEALLWAEGRRALISRLIAAADARG